MELSYPKAYSIDDLDPIEGDLRKILIENATERYQSDDSDTPSVMYVFQAEDLLYCFLSKQQRAIYNALTVDFQTTKQIALKSGYRTRDTSSILCKLYTETGLIKRDTSKNRRFEWKKAI